MENSDKIELQILQEIDQSGSFTQRDIADRLGIALGMSNAYIRRLIEKGYVMISQMPRRRIFYNLTPKGIMEKSRLTLLYMKDSLEYYRYLRAGIEKTINDLKQNGMRRVVIIGTGEIAEIVYIILKREGLELVGVVELQPKTTHFLGLEVFGAERLQDCAYDAVIVAEQLFDETDQLAGLIVNLNLPVEKMVLFSGHKIQLTAKLTMEQPSATLHPSESGS